MMKEFVFHILLWYRNFEVMALSSICATGKDDAQIIIV